MAGDWIKMRTDLPLDPAVIAMAERLGIDEYAVVGRLHAFWSWLDSQSRDGHATGVTHSWLDRYVRCDGFAAAAVAVGWLATDNGGLSVPNFDRHNGETAKTRALSSDRKRKQRGASVTEESRAERDGSVTREEKRREEKRESPEKKPARDLVEEFEILPKHREWAAQNCPSVPLDREVEAWKDRLRAGGYRYGKPPGTPVVDAQASFYTSCRNAEAWGTYRQRSNGGLSPPKRRQLSLCGTANEDKDYEPRPA